MCSFITITYIAYILTNKFFICDSNNLANSFRFYFIDDLKKIGFSLKETEGFMVLDIIVVNNEDDLF